MGDGEKTCGHCNGSYIGCYSGTATGDGTYYAAGCMFCNAAVCAKKSCSWSFWDSSDGEHKVCLACCSRFGVPDAFGDAPPRPNESRPVQVRLEALSKLLKRDGKQLECQSCRTRGPLERALTGFCYCARKLIYLPDNKTLFPGCERFVCPECFGHDPKFPENCDACARMEHQAAAIEEVGTRPCPHCRATFPPSRQGVARNLLVTLCACSICEGDVCTDCSKLVPHAGGVLRACPPCAANPGGQPKPAGLARAAIDMLRRLAGRR